MNISKKAQMIYGAAVLVILLLVTMVGGFDQTIAWTKLGLLAFIQNVSFSIVSRSRNRDNTTYHMVAAFFSNTIWFLTFRELVKADMTFMLFIPYVAGTMSGSLWGMKLSMWIEGKIGATADGHMETSKKKK